MAGEAAPPRERGRAGAAGAGGSPNGAAPQVAHNPATGAILGEVPGPGRGVVPALVRRAAEVQPFWAQLPLEARARHVRRAAQALVDTDEEIAALVVAEHGTPRVEAWFTEVLPGIEALRWAAREAPGALRERRVRLSQALMGAHRARVTQDPLGVVGLVAPPGRAWALPLAEAAMALMAGDAVVLVPAPRAALLAERIAGLFEAAGVPEGLVGIAHGGAKAAASLQRSSAVLAGGMAAASTPRGRAPMVVLGDAHIEHAARAALWAACSSPSRGAAGLQRVLVEQSVVLQFAEALVAGARALHVGDPSAWDTDVGPLGEDEAAEVRSTLERAVAEGATVRCGGPVSVPGLAGSFCAPAVLEGVDPVGKVATEATGGPLLLVAPVAAEGEALDLAAAGPACAEASVWTRDRHRGERFAHALQAPVVWINDHQPAPGGAPLRWAATRRPGAAAAPIRAAVREPADARLIAWQPARVPAPWWPPYDETLGRAARACAALLSGRDADRRAALRAHGLPLARAALRLGRDALRG